MPTPSAAVAAPPPQTGEVPDAFGALWEVWGILLKEYVDKKALDGSKLSQGAIQGMVKALGAQGAAATGVGQGMPTPEEGARLPRGAPEALRPVWEKWVALYRQSEGRAALDTAKASQGAIRGLLEALADPHTEYIDPQRYRLEAQDFQGSFEGIGAEVYNQGGKLILNPLSGSPAEKAGIRAGDMVVEINGASTEGFSVLDAVRLIRGPRGSKVTLTVLHLSETQPVPIEILRGVITLESVHWNMTNDSLAYVRISSFYENTDQALESKLKEALVKGAQGVVLDLRNNPGGYLSVVVDVASHFLREGLVVYEVDGVGKRRDWKVHKVGVTTDLPVVVLVNQFSASGSEVLAGTLQDHERARVVGTKTFGKGSVNLLRPLSDGGGLYFTSARWYTPKGRLIEGLGLEPDVPVVATVGRQGDAQLDKALEILRGQLGARAARLLHSPATPSR
ncbi:MAG: S41 family peptidase [Chloroflexi bacterium]|nr:S41 family peptidase [Chloroflexota bacterium]